MVNNIRNANKEKEDQLQSSKLRVFQSEPALPAAQQTQWQFGDWISLQSLSLQDIEQVEAKTQLALIVAVAHLQSGNSDQAKRYVQQAREWGAGQELCIRILASGAYNALGRASLTLNDVHRATDHFGHSIGLGTPGTDSRLIMPIRLAHQSMQLGTMTDQIDGWSLLLAQSQPVQSALSYDDGNSYPLIHSLLKKLNQLLQQVVSENYDMSLDGVAVFEQNDPFLPGKLALALAYWITEHPAGEALTLERCQAFHQIAEWTQNIKVQTWGIDFYLRALCMLKQANVLEKCVSEEKIVILKKQLDWRSFVNKEDYTLKNKPINFYGVAYSIAYHRYELGWEGPEYSDALLEKIADHYRAAAGEFGFADETQGKGRYDRYSFLLIAEIAHRFREARLPLPDRMKNWLKNSANYVLVNLNQQGDGFQYGRSIGAYGDTAFLEILSAAAWFDVISQEEQAMAYHFCCLTTKKFLTYWWDEKRGSVNLWENGRVTDKYRGKHRILGENFSLMHQHIFTHQVWSKLGFHPDQCDDSSYQQWLSELPKATLTWFSKGKQGDSQQAVLTWRNGEAIFNIPLINGDKYYDHSPYLPVPYSSQGVKGIPDNHSSFLIPKILECSGKELMPLYIFQNIALQEINDGYCLSWESNVLTEVGLNEPQYTSDFIVKTSYALLTDKICRSDLIEGNLDKIEKVITEWINHPEIESSENGNLVVEFKNSAFSNISFHNYDDLLSDVSVEKNNISREPFRVGWSLFFNWNHKNKSP